MNYFGLFTFECYLLYHHDVDGDGHIPSLTITPMVHSIMVITNNDYYQDSELRIQKVRHLPDKICIRTWWLRNVFKILLLTPLG